MPVRNNFKNPVTGEEFHIQAFTIGFGSNGKYYKDKSTGDIVADPETGEPLEYIEAPGPINAPLINGNTNERRVKTMKHYKEVAKKHNNSDEVKHIKAKAKDREMRATGHERADGKKL